jgi:O-antigen/teichoic acid export membrane protein
VTMAHAPAAPPPTTGAAPSPPEEGLNRESRKHIRGSSLLFVGRLLSTAVNFATQVIIVRYLSKADYGVFAYALALVTTGQSIAVLGLDRAISRFLPIYDERGEPARVVGTLVMVTGTIIGIGVAFVFVVSAFRGLVAGGLGTGHNAVTVLLILIVLSPIQALDDMLMGAFAVWSKARAIFFRKNVLGPLLRLVVVAIVIATSSDVRMMAVGYVLAGAFAVALYGAMLVQILRRDERLRRPRAKRLELPVKEVFGFALPLLAVDALFTVQNTANVVMLAHWGSASDIADYRVVQPAARLNVLVMTSFTLLFTPLAARLFAREDREGVNELYWRTAVWIAVCSFPIFAATFSVAAPITTGLFGERYHSSAAILALLSLGYYTNAALGFNGLTLRVYGLVRYVIVISIGAAVLNVVLNFMLIPRYGAVGAGVATAGTMIAHNVFKQTGLRRGTGISIFNARHGGVYLVIVVATAMLGLGEWLVKPGLPLALAMVAAVSCGVFALSRRSLLVADMFPELLRVPLLRRLVG